jgi:hypothetical protein
LANYNPKDVARVVIAPLLSDFGRLDRLAVDAPGAGAGLATVGDPHLLAQGVEDLLPGAVIPPLGEIVVDGALGREVVREHVPLAAAAVLVEDRVEHLPHLDLTGPPHAVDGDQGLDDLPLLVGQVGGIGLTHWGMLRCWCILRTS